MNTVVTDNLVKGLVSIAIIFKVFVIPVLSNKYKNRISENYISEKIKELMETSIKRALGVSDGTDNVIFFSDLDVETQKMIIEWLPTEILEYKAFNPDDENHENLNNQLVKSLFRSQLAAKDGATQYKLFVSNLNKIPLLLVTIGVTIYVITELISRGVI
jgi:hypothetical protein